MYCTYEGDVNLFFMYEDFITTGFNDIFLLRPMSYLRQTLLMLFFLYTDESPLKTKGDEQSHVNSPAMSTVLSSKI